MFTTAYDQYAVAAFEVEAVDYLLKPFGPARFRAALERVRRRHPPAVPDSATGRSFTRLYAVERGRVVTIPIAEVRRFEARDDYVAAHTGSGRHLLSIRLTTLAARLDPDVFVRIHRSHIVNLDCVREQTRLPGGRRRVVLEDGTEVESSRSGARALRGKVKGER
ncbi:MAG: LytR/AlgR family response regulator transcription factor [Gemmatimonadales bacterium]